MAVAAGTSLQACLNIVEGLERVAGMNSPQMVREMMGVTTALKSPVNNAGLAAPRLIGNDGKTLKYQLDFFAPDLTEPSAVAPDYCADTPAELGTPKASLDVTLDQVRSKSGMVSAEDYRTICEQPSDVLSFEIQDAAHEIIKWANKDLVGLMSAACGTYVSGVSSAATPKTLNLISSAGQLNYAGAVGIKREFGRHGKTPIVLGGRLIESANDLRNISNMNGGVSYEPSMWWNGIPIFTDWKVDDVLDTVPDGSSFALAWIPGAFRLLEGNTNVGAYRELADPRVTKTVINIDGYDFDFFLEYDPKCATYVWTLTYRFGLFAIPEASYVSGQNYISKLKFEIGVGDWAYTQWTT